MVRKKIEQFLQNFGSFLDKTILKNSLSYHFFCNFFDFTSRFTFFLLFHRIGYSFFIFLVSFTVNFYYLTIKDFLLNINLFGFSKFFSIFFSMPLSFQVFIFFLVLFYHIVMINTCLAFSEKINFFMKTKYNNDIMKSRHYNSGISTAVKSVIPAITAVCIFCGNNVIDAFKVKIATDGWTKIAESAILNGKEIPPHPVNIIIHTTNDTSSSIIVPSK